MTSTIAISLNVRPGLYRDVLTCAVEGGSHYWLQCESIERDPDLNVTKIIGCEDATGEMDGATWGDADEMTIHAGFVRILTGTVKVSEEIRRQVFGLLADEDYVGWDADTADCILQAGLLNDITFG